MTFILRDLLSLLSLAFQEGRQLSTKTGLPFWPSVFGTFLFLFILTIISKFNKPMKTPFIVIDPGHGGINPDTGEYVTQGKRSPRWEDGTQLYEGVYNRSIAGKLADLLEDAGIPFAFTVSPEDWRDVPLDDRVGIVRKMYRKHPNMVFLSIHGNGYSDQRANGLEVFTTPGTTQADKWATAFFDQLSQALPELRGRTDFTDGDPDKESRFYVLQKTPCPAVLVEIGFMTNREECALMLTGEFQQRAAQALFQAITSNS